MSTVETYQWEQKHLGAHGVYPGHPIVVASMIMDRFKDLDEANAVTEVSGGNGVQNFKNALSDGFIAGAGDAVSTALTLIANCLKCAPSDVSAVADNFSARYWDSWEQQSPKNAPGAALGRAQALQLRDAFLGRVHAWREGRPLETEFRYVRAATTA